jgi:hypothetical protein
MDEKEHSPVIKGDPFCHYFTSGHDIIVFHIDRKQATTTTIAYDNPVLRGVKSTVIAPSVVRAIDCPVPICSAAPSTNFAVGKAMAPGFIDLGAYGISDDKNSVVSHPKIRHARPDQSNLAQQANRYGFWRAFRLDSERQTELQRTQTLRFCPHRVRRMCWLQNKPGHRPSAVAPPDVAARSIYEKRPLRACCLRPSPAIENCVRICLAVAVCASVSGPTLRKASNSAARKVDKSIGLMREPTDLKA